MKNFEHWSLVDVLKQDMLSLCSVHTQLVMKLLSDGLYCNQ